MPCLTAHAIARLCRSFFTRAETLPPRGASICYDVVYAYGIAQRVFYTVMSRIGMRGEVIFFARNIRCLFRAAYYRMFALV